MDTHSRGKHTDGKMAKKSIGSGNIYDVGQRILVGITRRR
jgi:hypothetical protein